MSLLCALTIRLTLMLWNARSATTSATIITTHYHHVTSLRECQQLTVFRQECVTILPNSVTQVPHHNCVSPGVTSTPPSSVFKLYLISYTMNDPVKESFQNVFNCDFLPEFPFWSREDKKENLINLKQGTWMTKNSLCFITSLRRNKT